jgi:UDP-N-acetylmuramyl-tripeptide synthetase
MAAYGAAKARLFAWPTLKAAVINTDDAFGRELAAGVRAQGRRVVTYGLEDGDVRARGIRMRPQGLVLDVVTPAGDAEVATRVVGAFNAQNLLGVLAVLLESGIALAAAVDALAGLAPPAGRMQRLGGGDAPLVVIDYAHTPDALEKVLTALRPAVAPGRELCVVFGAGGDRDPGKRAPMGRIAATLADRVVVTSDNPRGEDPRAIAQAIVQGVQATSNRRLAVEIDRRTAIGLALAQAQPGDVVVIAGKGHEPYQEIAGRRLPFSDVAEAQAALAARHAEEASA